MINFFSIPDKGKDYQGYMVYVLSNLWTVVTALIVSVGFIYFPHLWQRWLTFLGISFFISAFNLTLNRLGYTRLASWMLTIMLWLYITIPCYSAGGIMAPGILSQMSVILTAGFLLGWRGGLAIGLLTLLTDFGFAYMEINGYLPNASVMHTPITRWIGAIIPFGTILSLQYYATNHLRTGLIALQREIIKREEAEKMLNQMVFKLEERVKELKTLYAVSHILQDEEISLKEIFREIVNVLPAGWQYPDIAAARICFAEAEYVTSNYTYSEYKQHAQAIIDNGSMLSIEVVYLQRVPESDEGPFLFEERNLINMIIDIVKVTIERRQRRSELKDYKYALDIGYMISILDAEGCFIFVNDNFCNTSKFRSVELFGKNSSIVMSDFHPPEYFKELGSAMQDGKPCRREFCNKAKDGTLYWLNATIVPFLDADGSIYQYLCISHDITPLIDYVASIEQIIFDIGHVIRRPVSTMLAISKLIIENDLNENEIKEISKKMLVIAEEMDKFINELNDDYQQKRQTTKHNIDIASLIDKRNSLFN